MLTPLRKLEFLFRSPFCFHVILKNWKKLELIYEKELFVLQPDSDFTLNENQRVKGILCIHLNTQSGNHKQFVEDT